MNPRKEELRDSYKRRRAAMSREDVESRSQAIGQRLLGEISFSGVKKISTYKPMNKLNEVNTLLFSSKIQNLHPGINISFVSTDKNQDIPKQNFELIIVPVLAFDKDRHRLGWGGGFYDRFLAEQPHALKIGLCFQTGFVAGGLPHETHDISLDKIITETKTY